MFVKRISLAVSRLALAVCALGCFSSSFADIGFSGTVKNNFGGEFRTGLPGHSFEPKYLMMGIGGNVLLSVKYIELNIGATTGGGSLELISNSNVSLGDVDWDATSIDIGLFGRTPLYQVADKMFLFSTLGIENQILFFDFKDDDMDPVKVGDDWFTPNMRITDSYRWWLKLGGGMEYNLTGRMYLAVTALYGLGFKSTGKMTNIFGWHDNIYCHGFDIRTGIIFKY